MLQLVRRRQPLQSLHARNAMPSPRCATNAGMLQSSFRRRFMISSKGASITQAARDCTRFFCLYARVACESHQLREDHEPLVLMGPGLAAVRRSGDGWM